MISSCSSSPFSWKECVSWKFNITREPKSGGSCYCLRQIVRNKNIWDVLALRWTYRTCSNPQICKTAPLRRRKALQSQFRCSFFPNCIFSVGTWGCQCFVLEHRIGKKITQRKKKRLMWIVELEFKNQGYDLFHWSRGISEGQSV